MKQFINNESAVYCDYTVFLNESFGLFCKENSELLKEKGVKLKVPQAVVDEMKAVPMSRMDDYILCCQGLERLDRAEKDGIAEIVANFEGVEYSEDYFYRLCEKSDENIIVITNDIRLVTELAEKCTSFSKQDGFFTAVEIEENGMTHRLM